MGEYDIQQYGFEPSQVLPEKSWDEYVEDAKQVIAAAEARGAILDVEWHEYGAPTVCSITALDPLSRLVLFGW